MDDLVKAGSLNIRLSKDQRQRLTEAADIVSRQRGEVVDLGTLARELIVQGADDIRARPQRRGAA